MRMVLSTSGFRAGKNAPSSISETTITPCANSEATSQSSPYTSLFSRSGGRSPGHTHVVKYMFFPAGAAYPVEFLIVSCTPGEGCKHVLIV